MDAFRYDGKRAVVVGAATGMGAAVAELVQDAGAEVVAMDRVEMSDSSLSFVRVDLSDKQSIEDAVAECGGSVDALFSCAGVADGVPGIERINFLGHRHLIDTMLGKGLLARGAAIGLISSAAGLGWDQGDLPMLLEYVAMDFDAAAEWAVANEKATYQWSKRAINTYVAHEALPLLKQGIRINATLPGPTDTPLAQANKDTWLGFASDFRHEAGIDAASAMDQAYPLAFLCSDAAASITGITLVTDSGYVSAGLTGAFPPATNIVNHLCGRV